MNISLLPYSLRNFCYGNNVDPDQMPCFTASELGLHCLHIWPKQVSAVKRVQLHFFSYYTMFVSVFTWSENNPPRCKNT